MGHSATTCFITWYLAPQSQAADSNLPHWCRANAHLPQFAQMRFRVTLSLQHVSNTGGWTSIQGRFLYSGGALSFQGRQVNFIHFNSFSHWGVFFISQILIWVKHLKGHDGWVDSHLSLFQSLWSAFFLLR